MSDSTSATFSLSFRGPSSHSITAVYGGDISHFGSTSPPLIQDVTWSIATFSTSSLPLGADSITAVYGGDGTFHGSVSAALVENVVRSSSAAFSTTSLGVATHEITAVYGGDGNYAGSTSSAISEVVNSGCPWTATVMPSGKSVLVQCARPNSTNGFTLSDGYQLRPVSFNANGTTVPFPTISINSGAPISLTDCLWPQAPDSSYFGYPNFFFPIPQPPADRTIVDDRNSMVFNGTSSHAVTASNLSISPKATFVLCFRATNPQASPVLAAQGNPSSGGWQITLGGTASAMTVTFTGGGQSLTVSQLTSFYVNNYTFSFGQAYQPLSPMTAFYGPTNLVANKWYRVVLSIDPSAGATLLVGNAGYPLFDTVSTTIPSFAFGTTAIANLTSWPQVSAPLYLGSSSSGGSYLAGKMGEIQVYSGTLTPRSIFYITMGAWLDFDAPGMAAFWPGFQGTAVADISGSGAPSLNLTGVTWDSDVMVAGYHANEGTDLTSSHGTLLCPAGTWTPVRWQCAYTDISPNGGFNGRYWYSTSAGARAEFTNTSLTAGRSYNLAIAYVADFDRTTDALLTVHDGGTGGAVLGTVNVNQTRPCVGFTWDRMSWLPLGTFTPTGTTMTVVVTNKAASGKLVIDAIRFDGVIAPVMIGPSDNATITLPPGWATLGPDSGTDTLPAVPGYSVPMTNRSGDRFDQAVKTNPKTMKVGYNLGPVTEYGPSYWYRNRFKDQYYAGSISAYQNPEDHLRGQCDVTPSGLWTVTYKTPDGAGNHVKLFAGDSSPSENVLGSTVTDNGETISGGVATRTYTVTGTPARNSPIIGVSLSGDVDWSTISILPPNPSNPTQSLAATDGSGSVWHPNFQANMSVGFSAIRYMLVDDGNVQGYNLAVLSDYNQADTNAQSIWPYDRSGALISSVAPVDNNPATDADGVVGFGWHLNDTFVKITTATAHNLHPGDMISISGTNLPATLPLAIPGNPTQAATVDFGNVASIFGMGGWNYVTTTPSSTVFTVSLGTNHIIPVLPPPDGRSNTITRTYTPSQFGASDWAVHALIAGNLPLADVCDLSNRTGTMPHYNLAVGISDQGAIDLGHYFATHLNSNIGIRLEYANEPFSIFPQQGWFQMWAAMGKYMTSVGKSSKYGDWGEVTAICASISCAKVKLFRQGWQAAGRDPSQVRHFLNNTGGGLGLSAAVAGSNGETTIDTGWSPYNFNTYQNNSGLGLYPTDTSALVDAMGVDQWLDHFEMVLAPSALGGWGTLGVQTLVNAGWGHWVDGSGNPHGTSSTPWAPGLKYVPGGASGTANVVTYEGGPQVICMVWGPYNQPAGSYMMLTKCRQLYRHPRMANVCESFLQFFSDLGHSEFMRFQTSGYVSQGLFRWWMDLDLYNQTYGIGDGSDGKNNNILDFENSQAVSPTYTAMRRWAGLSSGSVSPPVKPQSVTEATARKNPMDG